MSILNLLKYKKHKQESEELVQKVHQDVLSSCSNPDYVDQALKSMKLIDSTVSILTESARRHFETK